MGNYLENRPPPRPTKKALYAPLIQFKYDRKNEEFHITTCRINTTRQTPPNRTNPYCSYKKRGKRLILIRPIIYGTLGLPNYGPPTTRNRNTIQYNPTSNNDPLKYDTTITPQTINNLFNLGPPIQRYRSFWIASSALQRECVLLARRFICVRRSGSSSNGCNYANKQT